MSWTPFPPNAMLKAADKLSAPLQGVGLFQPGALQPETYQSVFVTGKIGADLEQDLRKRRDAKGKAGHVDCMSPGS